MSLLPKINLSSLSTNFLKQKDSRALLDYVDRLYRMAETANKELINLKLQKENLDNRLFIQTAETKTLKKKFDLQNTNAQQLVQSVDIQKTEIESFDKNLELKNKEVSILKKENKIFLEKRHLYEKNTNKLNDSLAFKNTEIIRLKTENNIEKSKVENLMKKLQGIKQSSQGIQKLINSAQDGNAQLLRKNTYLLEENKNLNLTLEKNKKDTSSLLEEIYLLKKIRAEYLAQHKNIKEKTLKNLELLQTAAKQSAEENKKNKEIIQTKNAYINKIQAPLINNKQQMITISKENTQLQLCAKLKEKNQDRLVTKLRQHQEDYEKLEQQNQTLQKLNQNISLSLNQCRHTIQDLKTKCSPATPVTDQDAKPDKIQKETQGILPNILAKLYSNYNK